MSATRVGVGGGERPERLGQRGVAAALDDEPDAALEEGRRRVGEQVEALLRVEPPDHADDRPAVVRVEADPAEQVRPAGRLARRSARE